MIFICGHHNTGKTTIAKALEINGFVHVETGEIVRSLYKRKEPHLQFPDWAREMNKNDPHYFDKCVEDAISSILKGQKNINDVVVTGNRQKSGISYLSQNVKSPKKNLVIFLTAPDEELYNRQCKRQDRKLADASFQYFKDKYLEFDKEMGIEEMKNITDYTIDTTLGIEDVVSHVRTILKENNYIL